MGHDVSSWFIDQTINRMSEPKRVFKIGTSDYSDRVTKWPSFKRTANEVKSITVNIPLANADGALNHFYEYTYTIPNTCTLQMGFTHTTSGDELIDVFKGHLKDVKYSKKKSSLKIKDRLWDFAQREVGDSDAHIDITSIIPSDIAWTLCTCYGGLSSAESTNNPDVDYTAFLAWAATFSADSVLMSAHYEGERITEALSSLGKLTDSAIWIEGDGKLNFIKFEEPNSLDIAFTRDEFSDILIDVESLRLINRQKVSFDYSVTSDYWQKTVTDQQSTSVDSFGLHQSTIKDETIWHVDSGAALNLAQRKTVLLQYPPKSFQIDGGLYGMHRQLGETVRLVDSFYGITSASGWRMVEIEYIMNKNQMRYHTDEATVMDGFYLDVSDLDGDDVLL